jgi:hypothetical protein
MRRFVQCLVGSVAIPFTCILAQSRLPQSKPTSASAFQAGEFLVGPSILLGNVNGSGLGIGVEAEYGLAKNANPGGTIGLSFRGHTYSSSTSSFGHTASARVTPVAVGVNYHIALTNPRLDPYAGLAIGYASASFSDTEGHEFTLSSGTYLMLDGGLRYRLSPKVALQGGLSAGTRGDVGLLRIAGMFKL